MRFEKYAVFSENAKNCKSQTIWKETQDSERTDKNKATCSVAGWQCQKQTLQKVFVFWLLVCCRGFWVFRREKAKKRVSRGKTELICFQSIMVMMVHDQTQRKAKKTDKTERLDSEFAPPALTGSAREQQKLLWGCDLSHLSRIELGREFRLMRAANSTPTRVERKKTTRQNAS